MKKLMSMINLKKEGGEMNMKKILAILAIAVIMGIPSLAHANLLTNGSFETAGTSSADPFAGWVENDGAQGAWNPANWTRTAASPYATNGSYYAKCWWDGGISQTVNVVGGQTYQFSMDSYLPSNENINALWAGYAKVQFLNTAGDVVYSEQTVADLAYLARSTWVNTSVSVVADAPATKARVLLGMWWDSTSGQAVNPPNPTSFDNVNFDVIPEPSSLLLLGTGIIGMLSATKKRKKA